MRIAVIDIGTSSVRAAVIDGDGTPVTSHSEPTLPDSPEPGLVEFDAGAVAGAALRTARRAIDEAGGVDAVGIANQRASTVVWDRSTGEALGPAIGWQDLRTVGRCLELRSDGIIVAPNATATKAEWLLDAHDPDRRRDDLAIGTIDSWIIHTLTGGEVHATDRTNAAVTGLSLDDGWSAPALDVMRIAVDQLPQITDSSGVIGTATALPGAPPIAGVAGDQQASLVGQAATRPSRAKITFGTGGMLDMCLGDAPASQAQGPHGTYPIVAWQRDGEAVWGLEAIMLAAGTNLEWLRDDLGLIADVADSDALAASVDDTAGVLFVPALLGLGTPHWDHGARGTLLGLTRGTGRAHVVRAVLEGLAHRGADLVEAAEADAGMPIEAISVDGGMSRNRTFVQLLADATGQPIAVSAMTEATTLGAAFLAGIGIGGWGGFSDTDALVQPARVVEPSARLDRDRWHDATTRAQGWIPELSTITFA